MLINIVVVAVVVLSSSSLFLARICSSSVVAIQNKQQIQPKYFRIKITFKFQTNSSGYTLQPSLKPGLMGYAMLSESRNISPMKID